MEVMGALGDLCQFGWEGVMFLGADERRVSGRWKLESCARPLCLARVLRRLSSVSCFRAALSSFACYAPFLRGIDPVGFGHWRVVFENGVVPSPICCQLRGRADRSGICSRGTPIHPSESPQGPFL
jgi:hypothetical protein